MGLINKNYIYYNGSYITSDEFKNILKSTNLYDSSNEYYTPNNTRAKIVEKTSKIINVIQPFETYDLRNTVYGRLITLPNTPLVDIGLIMLGKQMKLNIKSKLSKDFLPNISLRNIFNNEDVVTYNKNFRITKADDDRKWFSNQFLNSISNFYPQSLSPFGMSSPRGTYTHDSNVLLVNTEDETLNILFKNMSLNIYRTNNPKYDLSQMDFTGFEYFMYRDIGVEDLAAINHANDLYVKSKNEMVSLDSEYGTYFAFVRHFGTSDKTTEQRFNHKSENEWIVRNEDDPNKKLVWGRDGISDDVQANIQTLRGVDEENIAPPENYEKFNIKTGLLDYTKNLLIANRGRKIDITRKVFKKGVSNRIEGFQGSPLWKAPESSPITNAGEPLRGTVGKRQHTILDQYDNFAKTIRFDGNKLYNGNKNSVIHNSVIPRIHPTRDGETVDPKNLMFSIENLAVRTIKLEDKNYGLIDDGDRGITIPSGEVGPSMGRLMWFAPYDIQFSETTNNTFETTVMMGRGEPIYNYQHSERAATIRFKLIIDHPPKIKGMKTHKEISEFFAFGGEGDDSENYHRIKELEIEIERIEKEIEEMTPKPPEEPSIDDVPKDFFISFPNDYPRVGQENTVFDFMYKDYSYEIRKDIKSIHYGDNNPFGLNESVYCFNEDDLIPLNDDFFTINSNTNTSQYNCDDLSNDLNSLLHDFFSDDVHKQLYEINITTSATKLYDGPIAQEIYNQRLSERRAEATKHFLLSRINSIFGNTADNLNIKINLVPRGSEEGDDRYADRSTIWERGAKEERSARIMFRRNTKTLEDITPELTDEEKEILESLIIRLEELERELADRRRKLYDNVYELRNDKSDGILDDFDSVIRNKFYPAFYSQTPEDFHRRLTFLQQCMRQGRSIPSSLEMEEESGMLRARNSVFGRQPVSILRIGDFFHTKMIIEGLTVDYEDTTWDMNPEGFGMQPMFADVTLNIKLIGGQSLEGPIAALQNAIAFNHYANSTYADRDVYLHAREISKKEQDYREGINEKEREELRRRLTE